VGTGELLLRSTCLYHSRHVELFGKEGDVKASVVIPTKNPGELFSKVLTAVTQQVAPWSFEVVVIDSGSADGTQALCRSMGACLVEIEPASFGHGRTRNLAITRTKGEFIAMLTHDALPADEHWLRRIVEAVEASPDIAGAFGRHLAYPDADPYTKRDLELHFENFRKMPAVVRLDDRSRYQDDVQYRQLLHFFSDNNACLRRSVWESHPYPDAEFAEDQIWAKMVIEAGYSKAYAHDAAVFHSHSYSVKEVARRSFDESAAFSRLFGYDLCPSIREMLRQIVRTSSRDIQWSLTQEPLSPQIFWLLRSPFANLARQVGFYLGARERHIPASIAGILSRDRALKNNRYTSKRANVG
jgi:rhamnosyltransferase